MFVCPSSRRAYSIPFSRQIFVPHSWRARYNTRSFGRASQVPQPRIRPAEIRDAPRFPDRGQEDRPGLTFPDGLRQKIAQISADGEQLLEKFPALKDFLDFWQQKLDAPFVLLDPQIVPARVAVRADEAVAIPLANFVLVFGAMNVHEAVARIRIVLVHSIEPQNTRRDQVLRRRGRFVKLNRKSGPPTPTGRRQKWPGRRGAIRVRRGRGTRA